MAQILCVEDSLEVATVLQAALAQHQLTFAATAQEAFDKIDRESFALVVMDIELPDGNGLEIVASKAARLADVPVFFLTSRRDFASKAAAFSLGADDYIVKPFDPLELKLRIEAKLRKQGPAPELSRFRIGDLICAVDEQRLLKDGNEVIDLTTLEFRLFSLLAKTPQKIFSRAEILDRVWGHSVSVTDRTVDVHVSNLRRKLESSSVGIESVIGAGYRIDLRR